MLYKGMKCYYNGLSNTRLQMYDSDTYLLCHKIYDNTPRPLIVFQQRYCEYSHRLVT